MENMTLEQATEKLKQLNEARATFIRNLKECEHSIIYVSGYIDALKASLLIEEHLNGSMADTE